jgi:hypothetical protein
LHRHIIKNESEISSSKKNSFVVNEDFLNPFLYPLAFTKNCCVILLGSGGDTADSNKVMG